MCTNLAEHGALGVKVAVLLFAPEDLLGGQPLHEEALLSGVGVADDLQYSGRAGIRIVEILQGKVGISENE